MAHPNHHSESSVRKFGGQPSDYHAIHDWLDASKAHDALPIHRAIRHHSFGIFDAQRVFGRAITNSDGRWCRCGSSPSNTCGRIAGVFRL